MLAKQDLFHGVTLDAAFMFDFDGTLVNITRRPGDVSISDELRGILGALYAQTDGAVAIISGREIADIDRRMAPLRLPVAGQHGVERRNGSGRMWQAPVDRRALADIRTRLDALTRAHPLLRLESKGGAVALHYRQAPELEGAVHDAMAAAIAPHGGAFLLQPGKMVVEAKPAGVDKGKAIRAFLEERPFRGRRPLFAGDDVTDEYGFAAVNDLGGVSIKIGEGETAAAHRLPSVEALIAWLAQLTGATR